MTAILIGVSNFMISYWWLVFIVAAIGIYFLRQYSKTESGIRTFDSLKLNMPVFNGLMRRLYMARFTRTGQTLLATGVPMLDALKISSDAVSNTLVSEEIDRAANKVQSGKALSTALSNEDYIQIGRAHV